MGVKCQKNTSPAFNKRSKRDQGFYLLDRNLSEFQRFGKVYYDANVDNLLEGVDSKNNPSENKTK